MLNIQFCIRLFSLHTILYLHLCASIHNSLLMCEGLSRWQCYSTCVHPSIRHWHAQQACISMQPTTSPFEKLLQKQPLILHTELPNGPTVSCPPKDELISLPQETNVCKNILKNCTFQHFLACIKCFSLN